MSIFNTPILFMVFNRPSTTIQVFEKIRQLRPSKLYVSGDGPREGYDGEKERIEKVRRIVTAVALNPVVPLFAINRYFFSIFE